jgi:hypothetical protein
MPLLEITQTRQSAPRSGFDELPQPRWINMPFIKCLPTRWIKRSTMSSQDRDFGGL